MAKKTSGIYTITSKLTGNSYVGSSAQIERRWTDHKWLLSNNKHHNIYLQNHVNKHGFDDLVFTIIETIDAQTIPIDELKTLLLVKEQGYIDNPKYSTFNMNKRAESRLGLRQLDSKYYFYDNTKQQWKVSIIIHGNQYHFGSFRSEDKAIERAEFLKTLNDDELIVYHTLNHKNKTSKGSRRKYTKGYNYSKQYNNWRVRFIVDGKEKHFGFYKTEEEARLRAEQVKQEIGGFN